MTQEATPQGIDVAAALAAVDKAATDLGVSAPPDPVAQQPVPVESCPRCGYDANEQKIEVSDEDRREYHRALMGMRPFTKLFKLWGGDLRIKMTSLSGTDTDALNSKLRSIRSDDSAEILETSVKLKLLLLCSEITTTETDVKIDRPEDMDNLDIHKAFSEQFNMPEVVIRVLSGVFAEFEILVSALTMEGFDENFYKGGGVS